MNDSYKASAREQSSIRVESSRQQAEDSSLPRVRAHEARDSAFIEEIELEDESAPKKSFIN